MCIRLPATSGARRCCHSRRLSARRSRIWSRRAVRSDAASGSGFAGQALSRNISTPQSATFPTMFGLSDLSGLFPAGQLNFYLYEASPAMASISLFFFYALVDGNSPLRSLTQSLRQSWPCAPGGSGSVVLAVSEAGPLTPKPGNSWSILTESWSTAPLIHLTNSQDVPPKRPAINHVRQ